MRSCSQIFLSTITCAMVSIMFESDAIVYICTYYDSANQTRNNIFMADIAAKVPLPRCINVIIGTLHTQHSLIPFVCVFSDMFYFNLESVSDASRPVMINNTNSVPNPFI